MAGGVEAGGVEAGGVEAGVPARRVRQAGARQETESRGDAAPRCLAIRSRAFRTAPGLGASAPRTAAGRLRPHPPSLLASAAVRIGLAARACRLLGLSAMQRRGGGGIGWWAGGAPSQTERGRDCWQWSKWVHAGPASRLAGVGSQSGRSRPRGQAARLYRRDALKPKLAATRARRRRRPAPAPGGAHPGAPGAGAPRPGALRRARRSPRRGRAHDDRRRHHRAGPLVHERPAAGAAEAPPPRQLP
jgi:hypothetical protein